jgi:hypothetical protein
VAAVIDAFNRLATGAFDLLLRPLAPLGAAASLAVVAFVAAVLTLLVFRRASDQPGIRRAKSLIDADVIALSLYRAAPGVLPRVLGRLSLRNLAYLRLSLRPLLVLFVPFVLVLVQLQDRYASRPLRVGETALVSVAVAGGDLLKRPGAIRLEGADGAVVVETPPVRVPALHKVVWRVLAAREGTHVVKVVVGGSVLEKRVVVGATRTVLSASRTAGGFPEGLLHPGEPALDARLGVASVTVAYPESAPALGGVHLHWLVWFLAVFAASAWGMKGVLRVDL